MIKRVLEGRIISAVVKIQYINKAKREGTKSKMHKFS